MHRHNEKGENTLANDKIIIKGAREHNLKNINLTLPREKLIVMTGLSGSGKSSLAFDTIYADGQRRYVESLSSYARMFLGRMDKPDVDEITGLSPAISIDQKTPSHNPRSTVGTVTEIYDYLRLLYARVGVPHCPVCGRVISQQTVDEMVDAVLKLEEGTKFQILAPVVRQRKGTQQKELDAARRGGYSRVRIDGNLYDLDEEITLEKNIKHTVEIVVDRLAMRKGIRGRLADSLETALALTGGIAEIDVIGGECMTFSQNFACPEHGISIGDLSPRLFSFNNPQGACEKCTGLGTFMRVDEERILPNKNLSIRQGAIKASGWYYAEGSVSEMYYLGLGKKYGFTLDTPIKDMSTEAVNALLYGTNGEKIEMHRTNEFGSGVYYNTFEGIVENLERRFRETNSEWMKEEIGSFMSGVECPDCHGKRLKPVVLAVTVGDKNISEFCEMSIRDELKFIAENEPNLTEKQRQIGGQIMKEIRNRLQFLQSVGLDYLTLARSAGTLSGGESQRINLSTSLGSNLVGSLYILDEPSIGLHPRDTNRLVGVLEQLRDIGNTVIVVEHEEEVIRAADWIVDIGPEAGYNGGEVVFSGPLKALLKEKKSLTADYLTGRCKIAVPTSRRSPAAWITVKGARQNNLKNIDVRIPLGVMTCITGVSGSGKSSLAKGILYPALRRLLFDTGLKPGDFDAIEGDLSTLRSVEMVDQNPIGKSSRSNPVTYIKAYDEIRKLYADQPYAQRSGFNPSHFSFNIAGGRCEECQGEGFIKVGMQFMADVELVCEACGGKRFKDEILEVRYREKSIYDILEMTVDDAIAFFGDDKKNATCKRIIERLRPLQEVGLGYIRLGQSSSTLSGGESQRVKLASFLSKESTEGNVMFIFDEPTTGLHFHDINKLLDAFNALIARGHTIVIVEHNMDVIKCADWVVDLGPEAGDRGGSIVFEGTPDGLAGCKESYTGRYLALREKNE